MKMMEKIEALLAAEGKSQTWLAGQVGVHRSRISKWKNTGEIPAHIALEMARVLSVDVEDLIDSLRPIPTRVDMGDRNAVLRLIGSLGYQEALRRLASLPGDLHAGKLVGPEKSQRA